MLVVMLDISVNLTCCTCTDQFVRLAMFLVSFMLLCCFCLYNDKMLLPHFSSSVSCFIELILILDELDPDPYRPFCMNLIVPKDGKSLHSHHECKTVKMT